MRIEITQEEQNKYMSCINDWAELYKEISESIFRNPNVSLTDLKTYLQQVRDMDIILNDLAKDPFNPGYRFHKKSFSNKFKRLKEVIEGKIKLREETAKEIKQELKNPHHEMFPTVEASQLFEAWIKGINPDAKLRELSFIFRAMHEDKPPLIHAHLKPGVFKEWLNDTFISQFPDYSEYHLTEIKTYDSAKTIERENRYKELKQSIIIKK